MRRSCVIPKVNGGKPFEALWASVDWCTIDEYLYLVTRRSDGFIAKRFRLELGGFKESLPIRDSIRWQLAQALNPPIKVSRLVLDAMEKVPEAKFRVQNAVDEHLTECYYNTHWGQQLDRVNRKYVPKGAWVYQKVNYDEAGVDIFDAELQIGDYIQASDGCPLALQVLLQFNTEGELFDV